MHVGNFRVSPQLRINTTLPPTTQLTSLRLKVNWERELSRGEELASDCLVFRCSAARLGHDGEERVDAERVVDDHAGDAHHGGAAVVALRVELELLHLGVVVPGQWADRPAQSCLPPCAEQQRLAARLALLRVLHHETVPPHTVGQGWREAEPQANQQAGRTERGTAGAQTGGLCAEPARQLLRQAAHLTQVMPPTSPGSLDGSVAP